MSDSVVHASGWFGEENSCRSPKKGKQSWSGLSRASPSRPEPARVGHVAAVVVAESPQNRFAVSPTNRPTHGLVDYKAEMGTGNLKSMIGEDKLYFQSIVKGKEGDLWMMPWGGGIYRWNGKKMTHYPVGEKDEDVRMSQIYRDRSGHLWIASQTGGPYKFNGTKFEKFVP